MQPFKPKATSTALTDDNISSGLNFSPETQKVVPDSFADWLAQPAVDITAEPELEQDVFLAVVSKMTNPASASAKPNQH